MFIILEGPDCAGKSGLARRLADRLRAEDDDADVRIIHRGPPVDHPLREYVEPLLDYRPGYRKHVICDRWHLGELVYPTVYDRPTELTPGVLAWLELFLQSRGAYLVATHADDLYLEECGRFRGDSEDEVRRVSTANAMFTHAFMNTTLPTTWIRTDDANDVDVRTIVSEAALIDRRAAFALSAEPTTYVGPPRPSLLLIGDRRGVAGEPADYGRWPAFAPFGGTSGDYLMTVLAAAQLRVPSHGHLLSSLAFANANDVDDPREIWKSVGSPPIVALGVEAAKTLRHAQVPVMHKAPHPQYWRRFRHHEPDVYVGRLLDATSEVIGA